MVNRLLEVCVDDLPGLEAALAGGADRIELCAALAVGGLTPSAGLMQMAALHCNLPVYAMIRPRAGDFVFDAGEVQMMLHDIAQARRAGLAGVVLGASQPDGQLDVAVLAQLIVAADGMGRTLHRAFDLVPDVVAAVDQAAALGFDRILTSGGAVTAGAGVEQLEQVFTLAAGRIAIMPGAGITADTIGPLLYRMPGLCEVHASCAKPVSVADSVRTMGFDGGGMRRTDAAAVRALKAALQR